MRYEKRSFAVIEIADALEEVYDRLGDTERRDKLRQRMCACWPPFAKGPHTVEEAHKYVFGVFSVVLVYVRWYV